VSCKGATRRRCRRGRSLLARRECGAIDGGATLPEGTRALLARARSAPKDDKPNEALRRLIAKTLGVAASKARLVAGAKSRLKQAAATGERGELAGQRRAKERGLERPEKGRPILGRGRGKSGGWAPDSFPLAQAGGAATGAGDAPAAEASAAGRIGKFVSRHHNTPVTTILDCTLRVRHAN